MNNTRKTSQFIPKVVLCALGVVVAILAMWAVWFFGIYIGYGNWKVRDHQDFAQNGISHIQPAAEMEALFEECRHYIVYTGQEETSTWNATAYFGARYQLTLQVPVNITSKDTGTMIGDPKFQLLEVETVSISPSGQVGASFSEDFRFDQSQWKKVYDSGGNFDSIGFKLKTTPIPDFQKYVDASRPSNS